jgi:hypothetical protein
MVIKKGLQCSKKNDKKVIKKLLKTRVEWPYIAGWIDGDGCIFTGKNMKGHNSDSINLKLKDPEPIYFLANLFKSSIRTAKQTSKKGVITKTYDTKIMGTRGLFLISQITPYLMEKTNQATKFLKKKKVNENFSYLKHTPHEFISYFTGFFEAEGHIFYHLTKRKNRKIRRETGLDLVNTNQALMYHLQKKLIQYGVRGVHLYTRKKGMGKDGYMRKPLHKIFITGWNAILLIEQMMPYMKIKRKWDTAGKVIAHLFNNRNTPGYKKWRTVEDWKVSETFKNNAMWKNYNPKEYWRKHARSA